MRGKIYTPETDDNWRIALEHFPPLKDSTLKKYPVILCHGLIGTRNYWKQNEEESLVYSLQKEGYDVYILDLRGRETAGSPSFLFGKNKYNQVNFDKFVKYDVDRAIKFVLENSGKSKVNWIGHSMGGMVVYARIGTLGEERIANLVTLGSPFLFPFTTKKVKFLNNFNFAVTFLPSVPANTVSNFESKTGIRIFTNELFLDLFYNKDNLSTEQERRLFQHGSSNESTEVFRQFSGAVKTGEFKSIDESVNYTANLKNIQTPSLIIAGRRDHLGTPSIVRHVYENISSKDKSFLILSKTENHSDDYGHVDLVNGKGILSDTNPNIIYWLNERNTQ
jgi:poly(3-hydroxyalkanoate) synthetase